jgi:predicted phage replisome organizer
MAELKWVRIVTDIFENPKIILIDSEKKRDEILTIWFKLICLAGKCNNDGLLTIAGKPYSIRMFSAAFNRKQESVENALRIFKEYNMIEETNGIISIFNWSKHQSTDKIEKLNARQRDYMKSYRAKQKALCNANGNANSEPNVSDVEERSKKLDKELVLKESVEKVADAPTLTPITPKPKRVFTIPTLQDVSDYCTERKNNVDADRWFNYYSSNGWMVGKNHMKDWKAAVRTWESESGNQGNNHQPLKKPDTKIDWLNNFIDTQIH